MLEGGTAWSNCQTTSGPMIEFTDELLYAINTNTCRGNVVIQARVICQCGIAPCTTPWNLNTTFEFTSNICPPPAQRPDNPDFPGWQGGEHCNDEIVVDFIPVPGVHSYRAFYDELPSSVQPNLDPRVECNAMNCNMIAPNAGIPMGMQYVNINDCPQNTTTIRIPGTNPNSAYRIYIQSLCCGNNDQPSCDPMTGPMGMQESECFLVMDVPASCGMDINQPLILQNNPNSTTITVTWNDPSNQIETYEVIATPISPCPSAPVRTLNPRPEFPANALDEKSVDIDGLIPGVTYMISVSKDCNGATCDDLNANFTIASNIMILDLISSANISQIEICPTADGQLILPLPEGFPAQYNYQLMSANGGILIDGMFNSVSGDMIFNIPVAGDYMLIIEQCPQQQWGPFSISEICDYQLSLDQTSCTIVPTVNCPGQVIEWVYTDETGVVHVLPYSDVDLANPTNGMYQLRTTLADCNNLVYESNVITVNCHVPQFCAHCPNTTADPQMRCVFIEKVGNGAVNFDDLVSNDPSLLDAFGFISDIHFIVNGDLDINNNNIFRRCHFSMISGHIEGIGSQLVFSNCVLEACYDTWDGIMTNGLNGSLGFYNNSRLTDAVVGIAIRGNLGGLHLEESTIENCEFGLGISGAIVSNATISGVTFTGGASNKGAGITIVDGSMLNSDIIAGGLQSANFISGFQDGIRILSSSSASLTGFSITAPVNTGDSGIQIQSAMNCDLADFVINGFDESVKVGLTTGTDITLNNFIMTGCNEGLYVDNCDGMNLSVEGLEVTSATSAISILNSDLMQGSSISDIDLSANSVIASPSPGTSPQRVGPSVRIMNSSFLSLGNSPSNSIHGAGSSAITCAMSDNIVIENIDLSNSVAPRGIHVTGGNAISIRDNTITSGSMTEGIMCDFVSQLFICGNTLGNSDKGTVIRNGTKDLTRYWKNMHDSHGSDGLRIEDSAIGEQDQAGNTWNDSNGWIEEDDQIYLKSQFPVNSASLQPTITNVPKADWFPIEQGTTKNSDCSDLDEYNFGGTSDPDCLTGIDGHCLPDPVYPECDEILRLLQAILGDHLPASMSPSQQYNAQILIAQQLHLEGIPYNDQDIHDCLHQIERLIPEYMGAAGVEGEGQQRAPVRQANLLLQMNMLPKMSAPMRKALGQLESEAENILFAINQMDPEDEATHRLLQEQMTALADLRMQQMNLITLHKSNVAEKAQAIYSQLQNPDTGNDISSYYDKALEIRAFLLLYQYEELPTEYHQALHQLASLCAIEYGYPVYYARALLNTYEGVDIHEYDDTSLCSESLKPREQNSSLKDLVTLHPNPAKDQVELSFNEMTQSQVSISLTTVQGEVLSRYTVTLSHNYHILDLTEHQEGVYFIKVSYDNTEQVFKLVKVN